MSMISYAGEPVLCAIWDQGLRLYFPEEKEVLGQKLYFFLEEKLKTLSHRPSKLDIHLLEKRGAVERPDEVLISVSRKKDITVLKVEGSCMEEDHSSDLSRRICNFLEMEQAAHVSPQGQVLLEYILLLFIAVLLVGLFMPFASMSPDSPSALALFWSGLLEAIGNDVPF